MILREHISFPLQRTNK